MSALERLTAPQRRMGLADVQPVRPSPTLAEMLAAPPAVRPRRTGGLAGVMPSPSLLDQWANEPVTRTIPVEVTLTRSEWTSYRRGDKVPVVFFRDTGH